MESDSSSSGNSSASSDSVVSSDSTAPKRQQGQKRLRRVEQWGRKKRKVMKDSGKAYKTYKGERRSSKTMKESLLPLPKSLCFTCDCGREEAYIRRVL